MELLGAVDDGDVWETAVELLLVGVVAVGVGVDGLVVGTTRLKVSTFEVEVLGPTIVRVTAWVAAEQSKPMVAGVVAFTGTSTRLALSVAL